MYSAKDRDAYRGVCSVPDSTVPVRATIRLSETVILSDQYLWNQSIPLWFIFIWSMLTIRPNAIQCILPSYMLKLLMLLIIKLYPSFSQALISIITYNPSLVALPVRQATFLLDLDGFLLGRSHNHILHLFHHEPQHVIIYM